MGNSLQIVHHIARIEKGSEGGTFYMAILHGSQNDRRWKVGDFFSWHNFFMENIIMTIKFCDENNSNQIVNTNYHENLCNRSQTDF